MRGGLARVADGLGTGVMLLGLALASPAVAAPGDLDPSFGGGTVQTDVAGGGDEGSALAVALDGTIVLAGTARDASAVPGFGVARYTAGGALDPSFGGDGAVFTPIAQQLVAAYAVALQTDGKVVVAGAAGAFGDLDFAVARYEADGDLDPTFGGGDGLVTFDFDGKDDEAHAVLVEPGGAIVVVGWSRDASFREVFALLRLEADGDLDATFGGGDGVVTTPVGPTSARALAAIRRDTDGAIVAAGRTAFFDDFAVVRYEADGDLDLTFGGGTGMVTTDFGGLDGITALVLQPDGMLVAAGEHQDSGGTNRRFLALARYEADGDLDPGFSGDGKATADFGTDSPGFGVVRLADGRLLAGAALASARVGLAAFATDGTLDASFGTGGLVSALDFVTMAAIAPAAGDAVLVGGLTAFGNGGTDFLLARFAAGAGGLDRTFGRRGLVITAFASSGFNDASAVVVQADGKTVVGGTRAGSTFALARYETNGALDATFGGGDGIVLTPAADGVVFGLLLDPSERIVAAGSALDAGTDSQTVLAVARYEPNGDLDPTFGGGDGIATVDFGGAGGDGRALARQPDGKLVVAGVRGVGAARDFAIVRLEEDGDLDATFGTGGVLTADFAGGTDVGLAVVIQPDGRIVAAGSAGTAGDASSDFGFVRVDASGMLDPSFGTGGRQTVDFAGDRDVAQALVRQLDGKLVAGGSQGITQSVSTSTAALVRLDDAGMPDPNFDGDGKLAVAFPFGESLGYALVVQDDGRLVLGGTADAASDVPAFALARVLPSGALDPSFGTGGMVVTPVVGGYEDRIHALAFTPDGRLAAAGAVRYQFSASVAGVARYLLDGSGGTTTTTTTLPGVEDCGNCADDDGDGLTDLEDPSCCDASLSFALQRGLVKPAKPATASRLVLKGRVGGAQGVDPTAAVVVLQLRPAGAGELLCARVPAGSFRRKGKAFRFSDRRGTIAPAAGIAKIVLRTRRDGSLAAAVVAKRAAFQTPAAGPILITLGFAAPGDGSGSCASAAPAFRARRKGALVAP